MNRICVLLGTDHHPFPRLVAWADAWAANHADAEVVVQHGHTPPPRVARAVTFLDPRELLSLVRISDVVVTHGGPGTMMTARSNGCLPILVPRDAARGEHVDDHQVRFSRWVQRKGLAIVTRDVESLDALVENLLRRPVEVAVGGAGHEAPRRLAELIEALDHGFERASPRLHAARDD